MALISTTTSTYLFFSYADFGQTSATRIRTQELLSAGSWQKLAMSRAQNSTLLLCGVILSFVISLSAEINSTFTSILSLLGISILVMPFLILISVCLCPSDLSTQVGIWLLMLLLSALEIALPLLLGYGSGKVVQLFISNEQ